MALINHNFSAELPYDGAKCRQNPSPIIVEKTDHKFWHEWVTFDILKNWLLK